MAEESELETMCREFVQHAYKGRLVKVQTVSNNGFVDRLVMIPSCPIIAAEFKAKNGKLRPGQKRWRRWLVTNKIFYWVIDDFDIFCAAVQHHHRHWRYDSE